MNQITYINPTIAGATTIYAVLNVGGQTLDAGSGTLNNFTAGNWPNCAVPLTDGTGTGWFSAPVPGPASPNAYHIVIMQQAGGSPADTDTVLAQTQTPLYLNHDAEWEPVSRNQPLNVSTITVASGVTVYNGGLSIGNAGAPPVALTCTGTDTPTTFTGASGTTNIIAALLALDLTPVATVARRSILNALRILLNAWAVAGTTLTVKKEDDATTAYTLTLTTDPTAQPVNSQHP